MRFEKRTCSAKFADKKIIEWFVLTTWEEKKERKNERKKKILTFLNEPCSARFAKKNKQWAQCSQTGTRESLLDILHDAIFAFRWIYSNNGCSLNVRPGRPARCVSALRVRDGQVLPAAAGAERCWCLRGCSHCGMVDEAVAHVRGFEGPWQNGHRPRDVVSRHRPRAPPGRFYSRRMRQRLKEAVAAIAGGCYNDIGRRVAPFQVDVAAISEGCYSDLKSMFQEEFTANCFPSFFPFSLNVLYSCALCLPTHGHLRPYWPAFGRGQDREVGTTYSQAISLAWGPQYTHHTLWHPLAKYTKEPWMYPPPPLTKERSSVGRAQALHRLASRWCPFSIHSLNGLGHIVQIYV